MPVRLLNVEEEEGSEEAERWLTANLATTSTVPSDFGLSVIAEYFGKSNAVALYWAGAAKEEEGEVNDAIALYKKAYRIWPALDSVTDGGVPRGVREEATAAGVAAGNLLTIIDVPSARFSRVILSRALLTLSCITSVDDLRNVIAREWSAIENNAENQRHEHKTCTFLNNPPQYTMRKHLPHVLVKMLRFAQQAWDRENWSGDAINPGPLYAITGGLSSLSIRVMEYWDYEIGGGLVDPFHYDVDSVLTLVALLSDPTDCQGGMFRTNETDGTMLEHPMAQGDVICFVSHKYHNITPIIQGTRRSMVMELWQGEIGHMGR